MNDDNQYVDEFMDQVIMNKTNEDMLAAIMRSEDRDKWIRELILHQSAAALVQRSAVVKQVKQVHEQYFKDRIGNRVAKDNDQYRGLSGKRLFRMLGAIAAIFIITCTVIVGYWFKTISAEKLYAEHYHPYRLNVERGSGREASSDVIRQYEKNNIRETVSAYERSSITTDREKMAAGNAYLQLQQPDAAANVFRELLKNNQISGNRLYQDEAEYYLALACLKQKNFEEANQLFNKIYDDREHTFNSEVSKWFLIRLKWLR